MASDRIYKKVGTHYQLSVEWKSVVDTTGNKSTITAKMYWESLDGYGNVNSSATKSGAIWIDGTKYSFSGAGLADLSPNQKKLLATKSKTVSHKADGTQDFVLDGEFSAEVTLEGKYYGTIALTGKTFDLDKIARKSSLSSKTDISAGYDRTISIDRASSGFSHKVYIDIQNSSGSWIKVKDIDFSTSETSKSTNFTDGEKKLIFSNLNGRSSAPIRWNLHTYNGNETLGYNTYTGVAEIANLTTVSSGNGEAGGSYKFYVDQNMSLSLNKDREGFSHTVEISIGSFKKTITGVDTSVSWTPSSSEQTSIYNQIGSKDSASGNIRVYTYFDGVVVGTYTDKSIDFFVRSSINAPTFTATGITYRDKDTAITAITGNDQHIVQGKSSLQITIPVASRAIAKNGATMVSYTVTVNGVPKTVDYSATSNVVIEFGTITASTNANATITATDSRGLTTSVIKTITVIPYATPLVNTTAARNNGFERTTVLTLRGTASPVAVNSSNKNYIVQARYRYKNANVASWSTSANPWYGIAVSGFPAFSAVNTSIQLDETSSWNVQVEVTDRLGTTVKDLVVTVGRPILFVDPDKNSIGFGDFPKAANEFLINGRLVFGATQWASAGQGEGSAGGALYMNNSDITGANGIYFNDVAGNSGEGLLFLKSGRPEGSTNRDDYDYFYVADGVPKLNNQKIFANQNFQFATGRVTIESLAGGETNSMRVNFGRTFPSDPAVQITANTTVPGTTVLGIGTSAIDTTGFTVNCTRSNKSSTAIYWIAIWEG